MKEYDESNKALLRNSKNKLPEEYKTAYREAVGKIKKFRKDLTESGALTKLRLNSPEKYYRPVSGYRTRNKDKKQIWFNLLSKGEIDEAVEFFDNTIMSFVRDLHNSPDVGVEAVPNFMVRDPRNRKEYISVMAYVDIHVPRGRLSEDEKISFTKALIVHSMLSPQLYGQLRYNLPVKVKGVGTKVFMMDIPAPDISMDYRKMAVNVRERKTIVEKSASDSEAKNEQIRNNKTLGVGTSKKTESSKKDSNKKDVEKVKNEVKVSPEYVLKDFDTTASTVVRDRYDGLVSEDERIKMAQKRGSKLYSNHVAIDKYHNIKIKQLAEPKKYDKGDGRTILLESVNEAPETTYYSEVNKLYDKVSKNENIENEDKESLLSEINNFAATMEMDIEDLTTYVGSKSAAFEIVKIENDRKRKYEEDMKKKGKRVWIAAAADKRAEGQVLSYDEDFVLAEHKKADIYIEGAAAFNTARSGIMEWIIALDDRLKDITPGSPDERYRTDAYRRFELAISTLRRNISDESCRQNDVVMAFYGLQDAAKAYSKNHDEPDNELGRVIRDIRKNITDNIETMANTYDNARRAVMSEGNGKVSYANLPAGDIMLHQMELIEKYGFGDSVKEYNYEAMNEISKAQLSLRKKIAGISPTLEKEYEFSRGRSDYLKIKKNAKVSDLARYYVCSRYLDDVYSPYKCVLNSQENLSVIKESVKNFNTGSVKKEIERLADNKLFKACVENGGKNAFNDWFAIESESDALKTEYERLLDEFGGSDMTRLTEYAMNIRELQGDDITNSNREEIAGYVCEDVGKIIALQILTDPKNRVELNAACLEARESRDRLKELAESAGDYLKSKGYFNYRAGAENDEKCASKIRDVLSGSRIKANILKDFERLQTAKMKEAKSIKNIEAEKNKVQGKQEPKNTMMPH